MTDVKQLVDMILECSDVRAALNEAEEYTVRIKVFPKGGWGSYVVSLSVPDHWRTIDALVDSWVEENLKSYEKWEFVDKSIWK